MSGGSGYGEYFLCVGNKAQDIRFNSERFEMYLKGERRFLAEWRMG